MDPPARAPATTVDAPKDPTSPFELTSTKATTLQVRVQRTRLLLGTLATVFVVIGLVIRIHYGVTLHSFEAKTKSVSQANKLVDDYNAYSANAASAIGRPISVAVSAVTQIVLLRFASTLFLRADKPQWHLHGVLVVAAAALEYPVLNGFNAINVQLRPLPVRPVISMSDISLASSGNISADTGNITSSSATYPENSPANPVTNTVLRNLLLPHAARLDPRERKCNDTTESIDYNDAVIYSVPSRPWQRDMLPKAVKADVLRIPLDTNASFKITNATHLPMNASRAANLFANTLFMARPRFLWFHSYFQQVVNNVSDVVRTEPVTFTMLLNLVPNEEGSEMAKWETLVQRCSDIMTNKLSDGKRDHAVALEFSHVDVSPTIEFDAVTFEVQLTASFFPGDNQTPITKVNMTQCGSTLGICFFGTPKYAFTNQIPDVQSQVILMAACADYPDFEDARLTGSGCVKTSTTSVFVITIAKRLVADSASSNGIKNLRKIYSFTVGRLAWKIEDLSQSFGAKCDIQGENKCRGLKYELSSETMLLAGVDRLSLSMIPINNFTSYGDLATLVRVLEPPSQAGRPVNAVSPVQPGYMLLPHNIKSPQQDTEVEDCYIWIEDRVHNILNNHLYIEDPIQVSYTAAMFYLFQDGVVREVIPYKNTLRFDNSAQEMVLQASIPTQNVTITVFGCILLCLGAIAVASYSWIYPNNDPLTAISKPRAVAQVAVDETTYPPWLLHRTLIRGSDHDDLNTFSMRRISLNQCDTGRCIDFKESTWSQDRTLGEGFNDPQEGNAVTV